MAEMSMSLDGFVADENDGVDELFGWYFNGDVVMPFSGGEFRVSEASAEFLRPVFAGGRIGALLTGRRNFDLAQGWGGRHPVGCPVFVVSHSVPDGWPRPGTTFHDDALVALEAARAAAGDRDVVVATPSLIRQYLAAKVLDEIVVSLVPVLLGRGTRYFDALGDTPVRLSDPAIVAGRAVTHLTYQVLR
ncbi:dihydrofolate reductase family protein [Actinoplanes sp. LDG1-01]|uniref:Dihydrofolate reductase family protein n=1 Tax=Paractinoplanes lichenicola TaxID=2802976 RepID=A0ABS1W593_9ACTN|nr:dihydrofolate reductase family protein [Actinoplanes lichenicola]